VNLVQSVIEGYLRQGFSKGELARRLGVSPVLLSYGIHDSKTPTPKLLKALGIERQVVYTLKSINGIAPLKPKNEPKRLHSPKPKQIDLAQQLDPTQKREKLLKPPPITQDQVKTAMMYGLVPGAAWASFFTEQISAGDMYEKDFKDWCEEHGKASKTQEKPQDTVYAALGNGDAIELKPQPKRTDFRSPLQPGQLRIIPAAPMPEAIQTSEATDQ
jgi:hypothetical protein